MRFVPVLATVLLLGGCLSVPEVETKCWVLDLPDPPVAAEAKAALGEVRLSVVSIRAPYDSRPLVVRRSDGSVAFDPVNQFAALPTALIKGAALDVLRRTGLFVGVQPAVTTADVKTTLELVIDEMSLDCRGEDERRAVVRLLLVMIRNRQVVSAVRGEAAIAAADGNYSSAFGRAFGQAVWEAAYKLKR